MRLALYLSRNSPTDFADEPNFAFMPAATPAGTFDSRA